jgi:ATP-binding cassette subfamily F protein uup
VAVLLSVRDLTHAFASRALFTGISFTVSDGDRIGLIGPNGAGKSTLMRILASQLTADGGEVARRGGNALRVGFLEQTPEFQPGETVREAVHSGLRANKDNEARVDEVLSKLNLTSETVGADTLVSKLSGGWQKRVALARELVSDPDLLLLDEPTNHLDVESILWLEKLLQSAPYATITVTHDRAFLQRVSKRILELDKRNAGGLLDVDGDYATYLERKAGAMAAQEQREQSMANTLRRETEWLRRGPKARTTKQTARIERAGELGAEVAELKARNQTRSAEIEIATSGRRTKKFIEAKGISKRFGDNTVLQTLDLSIGPGTRLSLLGPNGCGKSTLLRMLVGTEQPTVGEVVRAKDLVVKVFEQNRASLDPEVTVADAVSPGSDMIDFRGSRLHRHGYLERFLFQPHQMRLRTGSLSGGEQSRLLIAKLMLQTADVYVLDEPTNDLDFATLEVLEEALIGFDGAVLLVSHDRFFVDRVSTQILAFHTAPGERGQTTALADLFQWQAFHAEQEKRTTAAERAANGAASAARAAGKRKKLSYKDQRDWDTLEARILEAETKLTNIESECAKPAVASDGARLLELTSSMNETRALIDQLYARWAELEALQAE